MFCLYYIVYCVVLFVLLLFCVLWCDVLFDVLFDVFSRGFTGFVYKRKKTRNNKLECSNSLLVLASAASSKESPKKIKKTNHGTKLGIRRERRPLCLNIRTSPNGLFDLVRELSDQQKQAVKEIGFGSLLSLSVSKCPTRLSLYLLKNFRTSNSVITLSNAEKLCIDEEDIYCVLNLPRGPVPIVESLGKYEESEPREYMKILRAWRTRWVGNPNRGAPSTNSMPKMIKQNVSSDENFKRDFVVYVVSSFISTNQNTSCR